MKRLLLLLLLSCLPAFATGTTTLTGSLKNPAQTGMTGTLRFTLPIQAALLSTGGCGGPASVLPNVPVPITVVNGAVTGTAILYDLACMNPTSLYYNVTFSDPGGTLLFSVAWNCVTGASVDIGTCTDTGQPFLSYAVLLNPTTTQIVKQPASTLFKIVDSANNARLTVDGTAGTIAVGGNFSVTGTSTLGGNTAITGTLSSTADASLATSSGNVGIGTASPLAKLHVVKDGSVYNSDSNNGFMVGNATTPAKRIQMGYDTAADIGYIQATFSGTTVKPLILNGNGGSVGIGLTNPISKLANTTVNALDGGGTGITNLSFAWENTGQGYAGSFYNSDSTDSNAHGLLAKTLKQSARIITANFGSSAGRDMWFVTGNGISGDGYAHKHQRSSFTTINGFNDIIITWPTSFVDANYTLSCLVFNGFGTTTGWQAIGKLAATTTIRITNTGVNAAELDCFAEHDQ